MRGSLSEEIARHLRPEDPFHLPPPAQPLRSTVTLTLENATEQPIIVFNDIRRSSVWQVAMEQDDEDETIWHADVDLPMLPTIVTYYFQVGGDQILERRQVEGHSRPIYGEWQKLPFKITIFDPDRMPADWTQGMIVYQIFPDRFAKHQTDEEAKSKLRGVYGHEPKFMAWGEQPELPPLGRDFFGGDLNGVIDKLDYLADLGVECLYFNPIFEASANHRYEAIDFMKIDPLLGTEADFIELLEEAHTRNIKVVLDAVFNHCSSDSVYFDIAGVHTEETGIPGAVQSKLSPYFRWFKFTNWPTVYDGWKGLGFMPEFVECPEMEEYFLGKEGVTAYWLRKGVDGWRADVAADNTDEFWRRFRNRIDETKPGSWLISEDWRDASHYMLGDMFNGTMNYRFAWAVRGFLATDDLSPSELDDRLMVWMRDTPGPAIKSQMNLLDSHDTERILTACDGNQARFFQLMAFLLSYAGAPTVYYGSEAGIEGENAEDGRRCFPWDAMNEEIYAYLKNAINFRKVSRAMRIGTTETIIADDEQKIYGFCRRADNETVYPVFNASDETVTISLDRINDGMWRDALNTHPEIEARGGMLTITLQPRGAVWYTHV